MPNKYIRCQVTLRQKCGHGEDMHIAKKCLCMDTVNVGKFGINNLKEVLLL
jgi:hypothetical protein